MTTVSWSRRDRCNGRNESYPPAFRPAPFKPSALASVWYVWKAVGGWLCRAPRFALDALRMLRGGDAYQIVLCHSL
eukprot:3595151-Pleurochrysis_carterae.AAC.2